MPTLDFSTTWQTLASLLRHPRAPQGLSLLLALFILYSLVSLVNSFSVGSMVESQERVAQARIEPPLDIPRWHLFGDYNQIQSGLLPTTRLNLTLLGVFYAEQPQLSTAIIESPQTGAKLYTTGASLSGGAKITQILPDSVIIEHNNKLQKLPLKRPELEFAPKPRNSLPSS